MRITAGDSGLCCNVRATFSDIINSVPSFLESSFCRFYFCHSLAGVMFNRQCISDSLV